MEQWVTWALQALIAAILGIVWRKLEENNKSIVTLQLMLANDYVKMSYWIPFEEGLRKRLHEIENWRSGQMAVQELNRRKGDH